MIKELKPVKSTLEQAILNTINNHVEQLDKEGKQVSYYEIIGTLEYVKTELIDDSYNNIS